MMDNEPPFRDVFSLIILNIASTNTLVRSSLYYVNLFSFLISYLLFDTFRKTSAILSLL